jgi:hypothetical protein
MPNPNPNPNEHELRGLKSVDEMLKLLELENKDKKEAQKITPNMFNKQWEEWEESKKIREKYVRSLPTESICSQMEQLEKDRQKTIFPSGQQGQEQSNGWNQSSIQPFDTIALPPNGKQGQEQSSWLKQDIRPFDPNGLVGYSDFSSEF